MNMTPLNHVTQIPSVPSTSTVQNAASNVQDLIGVLKDEMAELEIRLGIVLQSGEPPKPRNEIKQRAQSALGCKLFELADEIEFIIDQVRQLKARLEI